MKIAARSWMESWTCPNAMPSIRTSAAGLNFAPDHKVIFIEWWEIALFAIFWALETRRVARLRDNKVENATLTAAHSRSPTAPRSASSPSRRSKRENRRARIRPTWAQRLGQLCTSAWIGNLLRESMPRSVCRSSRQPADLGGSSTGSPTWPPTGHTTGTIPLPSTQSRTLIMTPDQGPGHLGVKGRRFKSCQPDRSTHHQGLAKPWFRAVESSEA